VLIVDGDDRLVGTVTDGDIRRALLRGLPLSVVVSKVMNPQFVSVGPETSPEQVVALMQARGISQVPVIDPDGRLLGLHVLRDLLGPEHRPNWAVIMAGGEGRRLWPITKYLPKPMLMVGGRPLVERIVSQLAACGFESVFVSTGYLSEHIETHLGDGAQLGCRIRYLKEDQPLGTGGSLKLLPSAPVAPVLVVNGDLVTEVNFAALMDYHVQQENALTLCVKDFSYQVPYGVVQLDGRNVTSLNEKPVHRHSVNAGIYVVNPEAIGLIPSGVEYHLTDLVTELLGRRRTVGALPITEFWTDIAHVEDYDRVLSRVEPAAPGRDTSIR
jgi:NDP-sugar pyrophosphorylase family protein